ncbi:hypothetical protein AL492_17835 [Elizabethkingia anophelis]|uniref:hypothetical protein n=1 Tax=Elizabethkingia anophelis TaxID=1117645 RepID=UPI000CE9ACB9|nr:hypothetical protein [Elizabethkingia anophelis]AVF49384.1 hypothetical protein AL491_15430 [Elizabethkingia anophelis]AVF53379.1 hypothetical protein AL492_17835 [Elizabethkingia anophelis]
MIVYIDLKDQIIEGEDRFAFYDTITDSFCSFSGCQSWSSMDEFKMDYDGDEIERFTSKIPPGYSGTFEISGKDIDRWREAIVKCFEVPADLIVPPVHPMDGDPRRASLVEIWKKQLEAAIRAEDYILADNLKNKIDKYLNE